MLMFDFLRDLKWSFETSLNVTGELEPRNKKFNTDIMKNDTWVSSKYRRAHLSYIDASKTKGIVMLHLCIFPHLYDDAPIFGIDLVAGGKKITGFFHDFSPTTNEHHKLVYDFHVISKEREWARARELPDWGKKIFSENMIAVGNVSSSSKELKDISSIAYQTIHIYLRGLEEKTPADVNTLVLDAQNKYCYYQKQNIQLHRSMGAIGIEDSNEFVETVLFPEV